ncbi:peroxidase family protein [Kordiimonas sp. SCSIO 12610]|uniref:peroxidase family protein n=1 Tax=Kordiimonas sp. SCSIO 12610 TaxID=2829597 RepID=UPI00210AAD95|nr:peroxidase family protein [Kordiimonas sp. SCSIO 12610]UTW54258.1 hypothetical protein KFF44_10545 [Kordiimonas sp. SCSIO 12610]
MNIITKTAIVLSLSVSAVAITTYALPLQNQDTPQVSPARKINRDALPNARGPKGPIHGVEDGIRSIDGSGNNTQNTEFGSTFVHLLRLAPVAYSDGISTLAGENRKSAREISNIVVAQSGSIPNTNRLSDYLWQWGQFLDHDIDLTEGIDPPEPANIAVPSGDPFFDLEGTGTVEIAFNRSLYDLSTGTDFNTPREQENEITAWIDASNVYGSDQTRANALRTLDDTGRLKTSEGNLLPFNTDGFANAGGDSPDLFLAGDPRANEQIGLTVMHTLFVREHNRLADEIRENDPTLTGDAIYEKARAIVGAQMQVITYEEFLPVLIGRGSIPRYRGYFPSIKPDIANEFSTAAYRFGHSALSETILRLDADGNEIANGHIALKDAFFAGGRLSSEGGIDPILRGLAAQTSQKVDPFVIDALRNFLFGPPGAGGFDLASLNIQRGRDHGLASYNDVRRALGLRPIRRFRDISRNPEIRERLQNAYDSVDDIDLWIGGLSEDPVRGGQLGELFNKIIADQFIRLRDGDRFWYERVFSGPELAELKRTRLSDIIKRNTEIGSELQREVFIVNPPRRP